MKCKQKQRSGRDGPFKAMQDSLEKLDLFHSMEVLFLEYFHTTNSISILWNWRGKKGNWIFQPFSTIFLQYFQYHGSGFSSVLVSPILSWCHLIIL